MNNYNLTIDSTKGVFQLLLVILTSFFFTSALPAQTPPASVVLNEASTVLTNPLRIGVNNGTLSNYDSGQFCKNWLCLNNPAFQGLIVRNVVPIQSGTATSFTGKYIYDLAPANFYTGATYLGLPSPCGSAFAGAGGTVSSNTKANGSTTGVVYTIPSGQAAAEGDWVSLSLENDLQTGGMCNQAGSQPPTCVRGWNGTVYNGAAISAQNTDLPPSSYDTQTLTVNTTAAGAAANLTTWVDGSYTGKTGNYAALWSGTSYTFSLKCRTSSGSGTVTFAVTRPGGQNSSGTATCTNSWSTISYVFTGAETAATPIGTVQAEVSFSQGTLFKITDCYLGQTTYTNPTIYKDTYVAALKAYAPDTLRLWDSQAGESLDDAITPGSWGRHVSFWQVEATYPNGYTTGSGFYDHLWLCQYLNVHTCWMVIPATWTTADYQHLIEFLAGTSGTYPAKRNALDALYGRTNGAFTAAIPEIVLELTDEPWNSAGPFAGEDMPNLGDAWAMTAFGLMASQTFATMKADASYTSAIRLAVNCQVNVSYDCIHTVLPNVSDTRADMVVLSSYIGEALDTLDTLNHEFDPQSGFGYSNAHNTTNGYVATFISQMRTYLPAYATTYGIYEGGYGTNSGTATSAQIAAHNEAMVNAPEIVQAYLEDMAAFGITDQNIFQATQDYTTPGNNPMWGIFKDPDGGQAAGQGNYYFRQAALGMQIANGCIGVGSTMYGANVTGETLYSTSAGNGQPAWSNLPYLTAYAFRNGNNRCLLFANTDPVNPATVSITGANAPSSVTENLLYGAGMAANNESPARGVTIRTTSGKPVTPTYTVPPFSVSALSWTVSPRHNRRN